jgi:hypothetical protein
MISKVKSNPYWQYLPYNPRMGITSDTLLKVLQQGGFSGEALLAREGIQNCKDAHSPKAQGAGLPVQVTIKKQSYSGEPAKQLFKALQLNQKAQIDRGLSLYEPMNKSGFENYISGSRPVDVVTVCDQNTVGLGGSFDGADDDDHFARLVLGFGQTDRPEGGGSFGFGKTVFAKLSKIHLVLYYSHFNPTKKTGEKNSRFMALWLLRKDIAAKFSGFGFFGVKNHATQDCEPFEDEEAHAMAELCGLQRRLEGDYGTTIAVIDCPLNCEHVKFATERYWWPSLLEKKLSVKIEDCSLNPGEHLHINLTANPLVAPYLNMHQIITEVSEKTDGVELDEFKKMEGKKIGQIATTEISSEELNKMREYLSNLGILTSEKSYPLGGVAKMRKPGMVVNYEGETDEEIDVIVGGVFIADNEIDQILRASEPPTHDKWDSAETRRIEEAGRRISLKGDAAIKIVASVNKRIANKIIDRKKRLKPPPTSDDARLEILEQFLSDLFNAGGAGSIGQKDQQPFSFTFDTSNRITPEGKRLDSAKVTINLNSDYDGLPLKCRVRVQGIVLEGPRSSSGEAVETKLTWDGNVTTGERPTITCQLEKDKPIELAVEAICSKKEVVRFNVNVENARRIKA